VKKLVLSLSFFIAAGLSLGTGPASAESRCTIENYTVSGEFDQTGYTQCLTEELPKTGSDPYGLIGVGISVGILGVSTVVVFRRKNRSSHV